MERQGYWGPVTASVDWCEHNYVYSPYIAEFFNSFSSLSMVLIGEFGARYNYTNHWKQRMCFRMLTVIGLGSILFHGSLKYSTQMFDELPMVWTSGLALSLALESRAKRSMNPFINHFIFFVTFVSSIFTAFTHGKYQVMLFRMAFTVVELLTLLIGILDYQNLPSDSKLRTTSKTSLLLALVALLCWITDNERCGALRKLTINPQLHACWHFFISMAAYHAMILFIYQHNSKKGCDKEVVYLFNVMPIIKKVGN